MLAIWARDGVCKEGDPRPPKEEGDPKVMDWLLNPRVDFGSKRWEQLLGEENIRNVSMEGHHFTMITEPRVSLDGGGIVALWANVLQVQELGRLMKLAFET